MVDLSYVDSEMTIRTWARAHDALLAVVGHRTFFALPDDYLPSAKGNAISLALIDGQPDANTPLGADLIQFSCWGKTKGDAADVKTALVSALNSARRQEITSDAGTVIFAGAQVTSVFYRPDNSGEPVFPRYLVTAVVAVLPSS